MKQGTDEWFAARLGNVTASNLSAVLAKGKGGAPSATRENYMAQLICEKLTGVKEESFKSAAMLEGTENEAGARELYCLLNFDAEVAEEGFILHPTILGFGASPDGLVGGDGLIEIKCPQPKAHLNTILGGTIDRAYILQMQAQMMCTGRKWCDFISYNKHFPENLAFYVKRFDFDFGLAREIEAEVNKFTTEMGEKLQKIEGLRK